MNILKEILKENQDKKILDIILIAHVRNPKGTDNFNQLQCTETEKFSIDEFYEIYSGIVNAGYFIKRVFYNELDFIENYINSKKEYSNVIIFNLARNGKDENKKTIIPSFCDLVNLPYTTSGSFTNSLARNKILFSELLNINKLPTPKSYYTIKDIIQESSQVQMIKKPLFESASQGIDNTSIKEIEDIKKMQNNLEDNNCFYQEFIEGIECEVPLFKFGEEIICLDPVGIDLKGNKILTYENSYIDNYDFFDLKEVYSKETINDIKKVAINAFKTMKLDIYGRVDFRLANNNKFYIIDIATTPYITKHSSFNFAFNQCGLLYNDIFDVIIKSTLKKYTIHSDKNCKSENNKPLK